MEKELGSSFRYRVGVPSGRSYALAVVVKDAPEFGWEMNRSDTRAPPPHRVAVYTCNESGTTVHFVTTT